MRLITLFIGLLCVVCMATAVIAQDAAQATSGILVKPDCSKWTNRDYKVTVAVKGKVPVPDSNEVMDIDSSFALDVKHKYTRRDDDGLMPLEISVTKGEAVIKDKANDFEQKIAVSAESYPKLTVLLDSNCRPTDVFGIAGTRYAEGMPGLNYRNMIVLFMPDMGGQARGVGEKWETKLTIPSYKETYNFVNTLKSVDPMARTATITQEISWTPKNGGAVVKATAESVFSTDDGKLLKSRAQCQVTHKAAGDGKESSSSQQEAGANRTNTSVDISLVK